jgi:2-oxoglutarate dehydrogenase E1 component
MIINLNSAFEDELYFSFLKDPDSVNDEWRKYFEKIYGKSIYVLENKKAIPSSEIKGRTGAGNINLKQALLPDEHKDSHLLRKNININDNSIPLKEKEISHFYEMLDSLEIPTASASRSIPVKALDENRRIINKYLVKLKRPRVSFTHLLAWSVVKSILKFPGLNDSFELIEGKAYRLKKKSINVGLAIDIFDEDGSRLLVVPNIKDAQKMTFYEFVEEFDRLVEKTRNNSLDFDDLIDSTITLTNPGMIGTTASSPRLLKGQGLIVSSGAIDYPTEFQAVKPEVLTQLAVSKVVTMTNTYDHRLIQGAESAEFLAYMNRLLLGEEQFYEQIFYSLKIPFEPVKWAKDFSSDKFNISSVHDEIEKGAHVIQMINAYRVRGHLLASVNPLGLETYYYPELDPAYYGFTIWDLDRIFHCDDNWEQNNLPLRDIIELLRETYCSSTGVEFMHIQSPEKKDWIKRKLETSRNIDIYSDEEKVQILKKILDAELFENYLHTKFVGHKRFSLEGGESVIVLIDKILQLSADNKLDTVVIGMAHRGRLNVLVNNIGKPYSAIFNEFEGIIDETLYQGSGDVKYHLGNSGYYISPENNGINILLSPNPSHLELVNPVVEGIARALDNKINDKTYSKTLPVLIHGDAAFAGQGIVAETLNLSQLDGYKTGGTIHIIINNQIGFTTTSEFARSTTYASDIAKMIQTPILHVNGNDPEAVRTAATFAVEYREKFKSDVIIDMLCYRKYGHNEGDEPSFTQPLLYKKIKMMTNVGKIYETQLIKEQVITQQDIDDYYAELKEKLDAAFSKRKEISDTPTTLMQDKENNLFNDFETCVSKDIIFEISEALTKYPDDFNINPKILGLLKKRKEMVNSEKPLIDWAMAELLALGSILVDGNEIRFSGQDSQRGTFSQRHAVLTDFKWENDYNSLNHINSKQAVMRIFDSPLSELAVLGFEYGYSVTAKNSLTIWEAQFGDFANGGQGIFDQYIACSEVKWGIYSNLIMLLPHGYDGQGPEHSSARLERYLQSAAENNIIVGNFTSPANYFHALRRHIIQPFKMPMILMTPKGMLRHPLAVSGIDEFVNGKFNHIFDDNKIKNPNDVSKLIFCSGKIYFELLQEREKRGLNNIAIARVEQFYPFHNELFKSIVLKYNQLNNIYWVQEEPKNMGAWSFLKPIFDEVLGDLNVKVNYIGRKTCAATATGINIIHLKEQNIIINEALNV